MYSWPSFVVIYVQRFGVVAVSLSILHLTVSSAIPYFHRWLPLRLPSTTACDGPRSILLVWTFVGDDDPGHSVVPSAHPGGEFDTRKERRK